MRTRSPNRESAPRSRSVAPAGTRRRSAAGTRARRSAAAASDTAWRTGVPAARLERAGQFYDHALLDDHAAARGGRRARSILSDRFQAFHAFLTRRRYSAGGRAYNRSVAAIAFLLSSH